MSGGRVDLHIHTTASSDGQHTPAEIFAMAEAAGLKTIAFADHNSVANLPEGIELSEQTGVELLPCFELNTIYEEKDLHLLAYFIDYANPAFSAWLETIVSAKRIQETKRLKALQSLGFVIDEADVLRIAGGKVPTGSTFLEALMLREEGRRHPLLRPYIDGDRSDSPALNFYTDFFKPGGAAYVALDVCSTTEGIARIRSFGGVPIQAHPSDTGERIILELVDAGLMGIEAYSSYHTPQECEDFRQFAARHGLLVTAGSDFHGMKIKPKVKFAAIEGNDYGIVERLKEAREKL